jgi:hypothetical protein
MISTYTLLASDPEGEYLEIAIDDKPTWAKFNYGTITFTFNPPIGSSGTHELSFYLDDGV